MTRGRLLSSYLAFWLILSAVAATVFVWSWTDLNAVLPAWMPVVLVATAVLRVLSLLAVWFRNKSGVIANILLTAAIVAASLALHEIRGLLALVALAGLLLLVRPRWDDMSWSWAPSTQGVEKR